MRVALTGLSLVLALALGSNVVGAQDASAPSARPSPFDQAAWLAGCWEALTNTRVTVEMWMPPMGELMLGASRTVAGGAVRGFEHLRIRSRGDTLVYTAIPSGQTETSFRSTLLSRDSLVFENPAHDFPQRIAYRRVGTDSLSARVEGPGQNNATQGFTIAMRRVDCTSR